MYESNEENNMGYTGIYTGIRAGRYLAGGFKLSGKSRMASSTDGINWMFV
jgi:hypothetical protein